MDTPPGSPREAIEPGPQPWSLLKDLVADALDVVPAEREALLTARCEGLPELRREAAVMLAAAARAADFLEQSAVALPPSTAPLAAGTSCGPFVVEELVGEGGFSEVYRARQRQPFERQVALKVLKPGMDSRAVLGRFAIERRTLARLEHPGIARILDAGASASGRPFVAMEFVAGKTLLRHVADAAPTLTARLALFDELCAAVAHAHQRGVIHRDLKPSNVMITDTGGEPHVKVIDFGIAKVLEGGEGERTHAGGLLGTPAYSSPEQSADGSGDVDTRTDVYALGVVLGELVTGQRWDPAAATPLTGQPRELGWIVAMATRRERTERYAGVAELAADVRAFAAGHALRAGPASGWYRCRKFVGRHRTALAIGAVVTLAWLGGGIAAAVGFWRADQARAEADVARREADATADYLARLVSEALPSRRGRDVKVVELLDASDGLLQRAADEPDVAARLHHVVGKAYVGLGEYGKAETHLRAATASYTSRHGELDWRGIDAEFDLAGVLNTAGEHDECATLLENVASRAIRARGPDHPHARELADLRAKLAFDRGRPAEAEAPLRELLAREQADGNDDAVAKLLGNLAQVLLAQRKVDEARAMAQRGYDLALQRHGADDPRALMAARKLAAVFVQASDHDAVLALLAPLLPAARQRLGPDHPDTLGISNYVGYALQQRGDLAGAEAIYRDLVEVQQRKLARLHPQAVMTLFNLGAVLESKGDFVGAEAVLRDAHRRFLELRGPADRDTLRAALHLADVVAMQDRHGEIAADYAAAVAAVREHLGAADPLTRSGEAAWLRHLLVLAARQQADAQRELAVATWQAAAAVAELLGDAAARQQALAALATLGR